MMPAVLAGQIDRVMHGCASAATYRAWADWLAQHSIEPTKAPEDQMPPRGAPGRLPSVEGLRPFNAHELARGARTSGRRRARRG